MRDVTILTVADGAYFSLLKGLVKSADVNFSRASLIVELVNVEEKHLDEIKSLHSDILVRILNKNFNSEHEKKCFCTNRRASLFREFRQKEYGPLMWLDADSIIRSSCNALADHLLSCDLTMRPKKTKATFAAGTIGLVVSPVCVEMAGRYEHLTNGVATWMSNQLNLNKLYRQYKKRINFKPLPNIYCDVLLSDEGIIWAAKSRKKSAKRYRRELAKWT